MAERNFEGQLQVLWSPTPLADPAEPTVAELTSAINISPYLPTAGVSIEGTENNSSLAMLDSGFVSESVGTEAATLSLTMIRDDTAASDQFFLIEKHDVGNIIVAPFGGTGYGDTGNLAVAGDKVEVYTVEAHTPRPLSPAENTKQQFVVTFAVSARELNAVVAA